MPIDLEALYTDLHAHPELSFQEVRTARVVSGLLTGLGYEVVDGFGRTGFAAVLRNGDGPCVWMRADMDALPIEEQTGLPYASTVRAVDLDGQEVPVMHACGHDMHLTAMVGAAERLAAQRDEWSGTVVIVIQPAEELGRGARAMLDDGLLDRVPRPDIVLGQHLTPLPVGVIRLRVGAQTAACDDVSITLHGRGGHGSRPHQSVDPVVMAAATVMRLQTVVSRDIDPLEVAVVTVGAMHVGTKANIIPAEAKLELSLRYADEETRARVISSVERIVRAEALASGSDIPPTIEIRDTVPPILNDEAATRRVIGAFEGTFGAGSVLDLGMSPGSEDFPWFAREAGVPMVFWHWGGVDPVRYAAAEADGTVDRDIPPNHSPYMAPVVGPTIEVGVGALAVAAREFLG